MPLDVQHSTNWYINKEHKGQLGKNMVRTSAWQNLMYSELLHLYWIKLCCAF